MRIILPSKSDFAVGKVHDPVIGNGDSVSVSGQVVEDMFGSSEWPFGIDYPALAEQWPKEGVERFPLGEHFDPARKLELSRIKGGFQSVGELAAKHLAQHFHRQEEIVARVNPALVIGRKATGRDHAMDMRMDLQILSPGVQNAEESDLCAHVLGIGGDLQQSGGAGAEQKVVNDLLVLQRQPGEFVRKRKHDMYAAHRQQFFIAIGEPPIAGVGLSLWAMPRAAGVERGGFIAALATAIQMAAERSRAAVLDGEEDTEVEPRQPGSVPFDEAVAVCSNDICHLERYLLHFLISFRERLNWSGLETSMWSSGLPADRR
jgi:hypothetical protein